MRALALEAERGAAGTRENYQGERIPVDWENDGGPKRKITLK